VLGRARGARAAAPLAALLVAVAGLSAVTASPARADVVRDQEMWVLDMVHAPSAWPVSQGQNVTVAVIDSGVVPSVSDLAGSVISGPDLSDVNTSPANPSWGIHGTWMASLIAGHGHGDGSSGIEGVAPQSRVLSIRVVTDRGDPNFGKYERETNAEVQRALATAIMVATRRGALVISMSLGYGASSSVVRVALQYALDHGVVVVASSGNSGDTAGARRTGQAPYSFPADYPGVLGVGAVSSNGTAAGFSSDNLSVEVAAPGVKVPAQGRDGQYWLVSGTSPACALTAGVAALIKSRYPHLSPALVDQAITASAQNPPPGGYDDRVGFGTVDAAAALTAAARLSRDVDRGRGVKVAAHFGNGPGATPAVPVAPRGRGRLVLYSLLMLACLALAVAAAVRLRRRTPAGTWDGGPWPGGEPGPGRPPRSHAAPGPGPAHPRMPPAPPYRTPSYWPDPPARDRPPRVPPPRDPPPRDPPLRDLPPQDRPPRDPVPRDRPPRDPPRRDLSRRDLSRRDLPPLELPVLELPVLDLPVLDLPPRDLLPRDLLPQGLPPHDQPPRDLPSRDLPPASTSPDESGPGPAGLPWLPPGP
jgi:subtilisin family serine protease